MAATAAPDDAPPTVEVAKRTSDSEGATVTDENVPAPDPTGTDPPSAVPTDTPDAA